VSRRSRRARRALALALPLAVAVALGSVADAGLPVAAPYARPARLDYLARALAAVRGLGADGRATLEQQLYLGARARCRAGVTTPSVECTIELADATCDPRADRDACRLAADVILANGRAENELVDEATRMKLVAGAADYRTALLAELDARRGALAAELVLAEAAPLALATLPDRLDRFCAQRPRGPDWQRCVAALVWYLGDKELR
jgi:hypothetical protein